VEVEVSFAADSLGPWSAALELEVRGSKPIKILIM
jgi:hypothetical protein